MKRPRLYLSKRGVFEPKQSENDILGEIRTRLEYAGIRVFRAIERVPKCYRCGCWLGSSEKGTPDLSGYIPPTFRGWTGGKLLMPVPWYSEIKRPGGKLRPAQDACLVQMRHDGVLAFKAESWEDVRREFGLHGFDLPK